MVCYYHFKVKSRNFINVITAKMRLSRYYINMNRCGFTKAADNAHLGSRSSLLIMSTGKHYTPVSLASVPLPPPRSYNCLMLFTQTLFCYQHHIFRVQVQGTRSCPNAQPNEFLLFVIPIHFTNYCAERTIRLTLIS